MVSMLVKTTPICRKGNDKRIYKIYHKNDDTTVGKRRKHLKM